MTWRQHAHKYCKKKGQSVFCQQRFILWLSTLSVRDFIGIPQLVTHPYDTPIGDISYDRHTQYSLRWRHNGPDSVSNHQAHNRSLKRLFRRRSKKTSKLRLTGLFAGNSQGTGEFPAQMASNAENVSIWWRHHVFLISFRLLTHLTVTISYGNGLLTHP